VHAVKAYSENGVIAPLLLDLDTRSRPGYPLSMRLGGVQSQFGRVGEEINLVPLRGIERGTSDIESVAQSLYPLLSDSRLDHHR
jgi:hypothetical protein